MGKENSRRMGQRGERKRRKMKRSGFQEGEDRERSAVCPDAALGGGFLKGLSGEGPGIEYASGMNSKDRDQ